MDRPAVAIIIPAFNEADTIARVVSDVLPFGQAIVVDDCSSDGTSDLAREAGAVVVRHAVNQGYDGALNSGFREAAHRGFQYVVTFDADGQHHPSLLRTVLDHLHAGYAMVIGIRERSARFGEAVFACYTRLRFGLPDPLCGLKAYRIDVYRELGHFDSYGSIGTELMLYAIRTGKRFTTVPVEIAPRHSAPRFAHRWRANTKILRALTMHWVRSVSHS